jgi:hypothetical protein
MMNPNPEILETGPSLTLDARPVSLRLPVGAAVFALRGTVWITQEHRRDDIILAAGERFDVDSRELILASAVKDAATIVVAAPAEAAGHGQRNVYDFARARALALRREAPSQVMASIGAAISAFVARLRFAALSRADPIA